MISSVKREVNDFLPALAGKLWVAFCVRRFGAPGSLFGGSTVYTSPTMGTSWGPQQYLIGVVGLYLGKKLFGRWLNGSQFFRGGMDMLLTKVVWTEGIARMPIAQQWFGQAEGDIMNDPTGQRWIYQGGRWDAMQGELVMMDQMDGELVTADQLDGPILPPGTDPSFAKRAAYNRQGYSSPYAAAYSL